MSQLWLQDLIAIYILLAERQPRVRTVISTALLDRLAAVNRHMIVWIE